MQRDDPRFELSIARLREALAAAALRRAVGQLNEKAGFDPSQPRVPAGNSDGGQWTSGGGSASGGTRPAEFGRPRENRRRESHTAVRSRTFRDHSGNEPWKSRTEHYRVDGSVASQTVESRDGSKIESSTGSRRAGETSQRSTVKLSNGQSFTFETQNETQRVFDDKGRLLSQTVWTANGPQSSAVLQPAAATLQQTGKVMEAGRSLYNWLSSQNTSEQQACYAFTSREYGSTRSPEELVPFVGMLHREQVETACRRLGQVEAITSRALKAALSERSKWQAAQLGTRVHWLIATEVNGSASVRVGTMVPTNPNFRAEISFLKTKEETYGRPGSIRIDILENARNDTVCVYDIKTGRSGLLPGRSLEIANAVRNHYGPAKRIIVTEIRPRQP
ncbi:MAG: hypothetical protein JJ969_16130 [Rhizobiaceae bacterium]|nr:hypothetical protein [Rhizobiaceae bacterium]